MKGQIIIFSIMMLVIMAASCNKLDNASINLENDFSTIPVSTEGEAFNYDIATKAATMNTIDELKSGFGLYVWNTGSSDITDTDISLFSNLKLIFGDGNTWNYEGEKAVWNKAGTDKHSFTAYFPYNAAQADGRLLKLNTDDITIDEATDYVVARAIKNKAEKETVSLTFDHIYSQVNTTITQSAAQPHQEYTITGISFTATDYPQYDMINNRFAGTSASRTITAAEENISDATLNMDSNEVTIDPIYVAGNKLNVTVTLRYDYKDGDGEVVSTQTISKTLAVTQAFAQNTKYNLNITFTPDTEGGIQFNVSVSEFTQGEDISGSISQS